MVCDFCAIPIGTQHTFTHRMQCDKCRQVSKLTLTAVHVDLKYGDHCFQLEKPVPCPHCGIPRKNLVAGCGYGFHVKNWPVKKKARK